MILLGCDQNQKSLCLIIIDNLKVKFLGCSKVVSRDIIRLNFHNIN